MNATQALARLQAGNAAFCARECIVVAHSAPMRAELVRQGQHPYAVIVCCSDSRVVPELIFGCGPGELFVVRSAGNAIAEGELASVLYAVGHLGCPLTLVLGHTHCGAVAAALSGHAEEGALGMLTQKIARAIDGATDPDAAALCNARYSAEQLRAALSHAGLTCPVHYALYDTQTGTIRW